MKESTVCSTSQCNTWCSTVSGDEVPVHEVFVVLDKDALAQLHVIDDEDGLAKHEKADYFLTGKLPECRKVIWMSGLHIFRRFPWTLMCVETYKIKTSFPKLASFWSIWPLLQAFFFILFHFVFIALRCLSHHFLNHCFSKNFFLSFYEFTNKIMNSQSCRSCQTISKKIGCDKQSVYFY